MFELTISLPNPSGKIHAIESFNNSEGFESHYIIVVLRPLLINYNFIVFFSPLVLLFFSSFTLLEVLSTASCTGRH